MIHAGYLTEDLTVEGGAAELFFEHRDNVINEKKKDNPEYGDLPSGEFIRDPLEFPTFHDNWISQILNSCLKTLNQLPAIRNTYLTNFILKAPPPPNNVSPGPIYDPWFVYEQTKDVPNVVPVPPEQLLTAQDIAAYFIKPGPNAEIQLQADLKILDPNVQMPAFKSALPTLITSTPPEVKEFIPQAFSLAFPDLDYGNSELSLADKQKKLAESIVNSFKDLFAEVEKNPTVYYVPIGELPISPVEPDKPGPGLKPIFELAKMVLDKNFEDYAKITQPDSISVTVNYEALKRMLAKPLYLSVIGTMLGAHENGFIAKMSEVAPDAVGLYNQKFTKDPAPVVFDTTEYVEPEATVSSGIDAGSLVYPHGKHTPFNLNQRKYGLHIPPPEFLVKVIEVAQELEFDPDWLIYAMSLETGFSYSPSIQNKDSKATGLIQFIEPTAKTLGTTLDALKNMSHVQQMDYVKKYFKILANEGIKPKSAAETYLAIFSPEFVRTPTFSYPSTSLSYKQNKAFDTNKDNKIEKSEISEIINGMKRRSESGDGFGGLPKRRSITGEVFDVQPSFYSGKV